MGLFLCQIFSSMSVLGAMVCAAVIGFLAVLALACPRVPAGSHIRYEKEAFNRMVQGAFKYQSSFLSRRPPNCLRRTAASGAAQG